MRLILRFLYLSVFAIFFISCVTRNQLLEEIDQQVYVQNFVKAQEILEDKSKTIYASKKDRVLYLLDSGLLAFYDQKYKLSQKKFQEAERLIDVYKTKSASEEFGSFVINDNVRTYAGLGYEHVFNNLLLSLIYLQEKDFEKGFIELKRAQNRITKLQIDYNLRLESYNDNKDAAVKIDKYKIPFVDSAFARLLSFWFYRADRDYTNLEVAARKYNEAILSQPKIYKNLNITPIDVDSVLQQDFDTPRVQVIAFTGRIPFRVSKRYSFNSVPNGFIITVREEAKGYGKNIKPIEPSGLSMFRTGFVIPLPGMRPGVGLIIDLPFIATVRSQVVRVGISINGSNVIPLNRTESLENIAVTSFDAESRFIYGKTITRAVLKMAVGVGVAALEKTELGGWAQLISSAVQIANNVSEKADLRSVRYLPAHIWTADIDLASLKDYFLQTDNSAQKIQIFYYDVNDNVLFTEEKSIVLKNKVANLNVINYTFLQ